MRAMNLLYCNVWNFTKSAPSYCYQMIVTTIHINHFVKYSIMERVWDGCVYNSREAKVDCICTGERKVWVVRLVRMKYRIFFNSELLSPCFRYAFVIGLTWFRVVLSIATLTFSKGYYVKSAPIYYLFRILHRYEFNRYSCNFRIWV